MMRTLTALLVGLTLGITLMACEQSTPEDEAMSKRREPPAEKRAAPGSGLGLSSETGETTDEPPPTGGGGD